MSEKKKVSFFFLCFEFQWTFVFELSVRLIINKVAIFSTLDYECGYSIWLPVAFFLQFCNLLYSYQLTLEIK